MITDTLHVVHPCAAGVDVHKHQLTATVRLATGAGEPMCETQTFRALGPGLDALAEWLTSHAVTAVAMERTGVYWRAPLDRLEAVLMALRVPACGVEVSRQGSQAAAGRVWMLGIHNAFGACQRYWPAVLLAVASVPGITGPHAGLSTFPGLRRETTGRSAPVPRLRRRCRRLLQPGLR